MEPEFVDARLLLGNLLLAQDQTAVALEHYREAVRVAKTTRDRAEALEHLRKAATAADPKVREAAAAMLKQLQAQ